MNPTNRINAPRPSRASMEGVSPLMYSCQQGDTQQIRHLIQRKVIRFQNSNYLHSIFTNEFVFKANVCERK